MNPTRLSSRCWLLRVALMVRMLLVLLAMLAMASCASHAAIEKIGVDFVVVRHAEKSTDDPRDPSLSAAGQARAIALAKRFATTPLTAAYATGYRRTQQTAEPAAKAGGLAVRTYDAARPSAAFAAELRSAHLQGTILVVGHSNTVPAIVASLCSCEVAPLGDDEFDRLYEVRIDGSGRAVLEQQKY